MRATIKNSLLVALMFGTLISYANEITTPTNSVDAKKVKIEYKTVKKGNAVTILTENGLIIYKQVIESSGNYSKVFDLTNLENGLYTSELEKDFEILITKFEVKNGLVTFLKKENNKIFKPVIRIKGDLLLISKLDFNKQPLKVVLYYKDNIILSETIKGKKVLNRVYKLSKKEREMYKVVINSDNRSYIKEFKL